MKILIIVPTYSPNADGVQKVTQYQAEGLARRGHQVTVLTSFLHKNLSEHEEINNVSVRRINAYNQNMFFVGDRKGFHTFVQNESKIIDVLICVCVESFSSAWILPIIKNISCRKILYNHGMHKFSWSDFNLVSFKEITKKFLRDIRWGGHYSLNWNRYQRFDGVCFLHEKDDAYIFFEKHKYKGNKTIIFNAADDVFFDDNVRKRKQIINVGTFNSRKNQKLALEVYYEANLKDYSLVLVGTPSNNYYEELIEYNNSLKHQYGDRNVTIFCDISRDKTVDLIRQSSIYLQTSSWEAFPVSIVEALSSGAAFVSTNVGIVKDFPGGIVCQTKNELIQSLIDITNNLDTYMKEAKEYALRHFRQADQISKLESFIS